MLVNNLNTNNIGIGVKLKLLLLDGGLHWVWRVEDIIKFLKLRELLVSDFRRLLEEGDLTVRFLVSGAKKKAIPAWTKHQTRKTM